MAKRVKKALKSAESIKMEIEKHFDKIEQDIEEGNIDRGRYHCKEIDKSLITALEIKLKVAGENNKLIVEKIEKYRKRLEEMIKRIEN